LKKKIKLFDSNQNWICLFFFIWVSIKLAMQPFGFLLVLNESPSDVSSRIIDLKMLNDTNTKNETNDATTMTITISGKPVRCALADMRTSLPNLNITIVEESDDSRSVVRDEMRHWSNEITKRRLDIGYLDGEIARLIEVIHATDDGGDLHGKNLSDLITVRGSHKRAIAALTSPTYSAHTTLRTCTTTFMLSPGVSCVVPCLPATLVWCCTTPSLPHISVTNNTRTVDQNYAKSYYKTLMDHTSEHVRVRSRGKTDMTIEHVERVWDVHVKHDHQ